MFSLWERGAQGRTWGQVKSPPVFVSEYDPTSQIGLVDRPIELSGQTRGLHRRIVSLLSLLRFV
jgi:hypothetical protein